MFKHFRKFISVFICLVIFGSSSITFANSANNNTYSVPIVSAGSGILINANTGQILYSKNAFSCMYPASTTKTLTAILAIENLNLDKEVTASVKSCSIPCDGSTIGIKAGEKMTVRNLLYALMLDSANEAANILAEQISGSVPAFALRMNKKAKELGATGSNFVNANGYPDSRHHTTAYDLSRIAMYAMRNPIFRKIVSTSSYKIPATNKHPNGIVLSNTNKLVNRSRGGQLFYTYATGIKTGTSNSSGRVLVSSAKKGNVELIAVVMKDPNMFSDSIKLFNYGFSNFKTIKLAQKGVTIGSVALNDKLESKLPFAPLNNFEYMINIKSTSVPQLKFEYKKITLPIYTNTIIGKANYYLDGKLVGSVPIYATQNKK